MEGESCRDCESFAGPEVLSKSKLTPAIRGSNSSSRSNNNGKNNENWAEAHLGIRVHFAQIRFDCSYTVECKLLLLLFVHFFCCFLCFFPLSLSVASFHLVPSFALHVSSLLLCVFFNLICMLLLLLLLLLCFSLLFSCAQFLYLSLPCSLAHGGFNLTSHKCLHFNL